MSLLKATTTHHHVSGLPKDDAVNTLYFGTPPSGPTVAITDAIIAMLANFWTVAPAAGGSAIDAFLAGTIDRTPGMTIEIYSKEIGEKDFGSAIDRGTIAYPSPVGAATNLPAEVAVCMSFEGDLTDIPEEEGLTRPAARRRGRIFIGPLNSAASTSTAATIALPSTALLNAIEDGGQRLLDATEANADVSWLVAHAVNTAGWTSTPVVDGWVDNEFDTQRRRGHRATARQHFA